MRLTPEQIRASIERDLKDPEYVKNLRESFEEMDAFIAKLKEEER